MDCNNSDLPKGSCTKNTAVEENFLSTNQKADSPLLKTSDPDKKREEELSAKEQEVRRKFKEKFNRLKKMPMPPQPTINVNSEGLTEESLPSATPDLEKAVGVGKKQPNDIKVCVGTKPIESAICRFRSVLPMKRSAAADKDLASMFCKSVGDGVLPEQYINNEQLVLISKQKPKQKGNNEQIVLPPSPKPKESENPSNMTTPENNLEAKMNLKPLDTTEAAPTAPTPAPAIKTEENALPIKNGTTPLYLDTPTIGLDDIPPKIKSVEKSTELVTEEKVTAPVRTEELKEPINKADNVRGGLLKNFGLFDSKLYNPKIWIRDKIKDSTKLKMMPFSSISKFPLKWRQCFVILGTIIPFYYTYHKIVTDNKLTTIKISEEN